VLVALDTPYADTSAGDLRFALGLPAQPALRTLVVPTPFDSAVVLRLLGASHQVRFGPVDETVAYLPDAGAALPSRFERPGYRFRATVAMLAPSEFAARCAELRAQAAAEPHALAGVFPGARDALTVLAAGPLRDGRRGVAWWTAHAYPQSGELVLTESEVEVP
jgi:hypothetical protein